METAIICVGNRLVPEDSAGPAVYDCLQNRTLPAGVEVIEGGTAGLSLLPLLERDGRVIFVDSVSGYSKDGHFVILDEETLTAEATSPHFGHDIGLPYILSVFPEVGNGKRPEHIVLVGLEGVCPGNIIEKAAAFCLWLAVSDPWRIQNLQKDLDLGSWQKID